MDCDTVVVIKLRSDTIKTLVNIEQFICFDNFIRNSSVNISKILLYVMFALSFLSTCPLIWFHM